MEREKGRNLEFVLRYVGIAVGTTLVDTLTFHSTYRGVGVLGATTLAWVLAVLFSYIGNCKVLFHTKFHIVKFYKYYASRFATYLLSMGLMYIMPIGIHPTVYKVVVGAGIMVINYLTTVTILADK